MRLSNEELQKKIEENGCKYSLSWSKLNVYISDKYSYLLKYIKHIPEERSNSYAFLGNIVHNGLEDLYEGTKTIDEIIQTFEDKFTEQRMSSINFVKDEEKNKKIEEGYYTCIKHFFHNYEKVSKDSKLEIFVGWKFGDYFMQGYIDHMYPTQEYIYKLDENGELVKDENNNPIVEKTLPFITIEDFKTSTIYTGAKIKQNSGQLKLYAYMVSKMYNIPIEYIKLNWNFLKYVSIDIQQKNGKIKTSHILRNDIPTALSTKMKMWAKAFKYSDDEIENFYNILCKNASEYKDKNIFDGIPEEISEKFVIRDCTVNIPIDAESMEEFIKYINDTIKEMDQKIMLYKVSKDEKLFWSEITKNNSFYYLNLCGYTAKNHKPLKEYLDKISTFEESPSENYTLSDDVMNMLFGTQT